MRGAGQIAELAALAPPDVACITAIGPVHLELLGTVEAVAAAKAEILRRPAAGRARPWCRTESRSWSRISQPSTPA